MSTPIIGVPKFDRKGATFARFAMRGCFTRLALCFDSQATYTGAEVQNLLLAAMVSIDNSPLDGELLFPEDRTEQDL